MVPARAQARMMPYPTLTPQPDPDLPLIQAIARGDGRALTELYTRHGANVLNYLTSYLDDRQLAEEVLQDVMMAVWKHAGSFRGESKVRTWLLTIARNRAINAGRRYTPRLVELDENFHAGDDTPHESAETRTQQQLLRDAINELPKFHQEILILVFYHGLSGQETAEVLGVSVGTVKSRLHRAKDLLRRVLQSSGENWGEMFNA
ncbi:MAG: sigma-70 family RNA polymerase sigma factor [bacterium]|nr:sigma-70 family RNA polymerase sigma factor [bacterium]